MGKGYSNVTRNGEVGGKKRVVLDCRPIATNKVLQLVLVRGGTCRHRGPPILQRSVPGSKIYATLDDPLAGPSNVVRLLRAPFVIGGGMCTPLGRRSRGGGGRVVRTGPFRVAGGDMCHSRWLRRHMLRRGWDCHAFMAGESVTWRDLRTRSVIDRGFTSPHL